jgi:hypothetical protein
MRRGSRCTSRTEKNGSLVPTQIAIGIFRLALEIISISVFERNAPA